MQDRRHTPLDVKNRLQNRILYGLAGAALVLCLWTSIWGQDGLLRLWELHRTRVQLQVENHRILMDNLRLQRQIRALASPHVLEQQARKELGYVRPDEDVFVVE